MFCFLCYQRRGPVCWETTSLLIRPLHEGCSQHVAAAERGIVRGGDLLEREQRDKSDALMKFDFQD